MQLTKVRLQNFGPYEDSTFELSSGLIGIVGPNGSGKSTLVNGIYACLTNDFSRFDGRKTGIIRDTAGADDKSSVVVCGEHQGVHFQLIRSLRPNSSKLTMGDFSYTKATDIEKHLIRDLGLNRKLIDAYVFVNQWDMFSFLSQTDSKRAEVFQSLCGTEKSTNIYDACTKFMADKEFTADVVDNGDEIEAVLSALRKDLKQLTDDRNDKSRFLMKKSNYISAKKITKAHVVLLSKQKDAEAIQSVLPQLEHEKEDVRQSLVQANRTCEKLEGFASRAFEAMSELKEGKLLQEQASKIKRRRDSLLLKRSSYDNIKPVFEVPEKKVCPTCDQVVEDNKLVEIYKREYQKNLRAYEDAVGSIESDLLEAGDVNETHLNFNLEIWDHALSSHEEAKEAHNESRKCVFSLEKRLAKIEGKIHANDMLLSDLKSTIRRLSVEGYNKIYQRATRRLQEHESSALHIRSLNGSINVKLESIAHNEKLLFSLREKLDKRARYVNLLRVIEGARELFHWQNLPRKVAQANLSSITGEINVALENFGSPFWVEADINLSFKVHFPGAPTRSAGALSGGQKVILAICFRSAVNRLFGGNIGMMFLDEPTSGLDDGNIEYFKEVLSHMANKIRHKYQLFVITHAQALSSSFDKTISIGG